MRIIFHGMSLQKQMDSRFRGNDNRAMREVYELIRLDYLMVIPIIHGDCIGAVKPKRDTPVTTHPNRPCAFFGSAQLIRYFVQSQDSS